MPARITAKHTSTAGWTFSRGEAATLGIDSPNRDKGGTRLAVWVEKRGGDRAVILIVPNPGTADDEAGRDGLSTRGTGTGDMNAHRSGGKGGERVRSNDGRGQGRVRLAVGRGTGRGSRVGPGSHDTGKVGGSSKGSESPSWVENPRADIAARGGRIPKDEGRAGGSAAGEAHAGGHVHGAGWIDLIDVPAKLAGAAAVAVILLDADIAGFAGKLFQRVVRGLVRAKVARAVTAEAKHVAKKRLGDAEVAMRRDAPNLRSTQAAEAAKHVPRALELEFYDKLQAHARKQAQSYRDIAARAAARGDGVSAHVRKVADENMRAWRQIEEAAAEQAGSIRAAARPPDSVTRQPYDAHRTRADLEANHPGNVTSTTVPDEKAPNLKLRGQAHRRTHIPYDSRGFPIFDHVARYDLRLPRQAWVGKGRRAHMRAATRELREAIRSGRVPRSRFTAKQLRAIDKGLPEIPDVTWHHHQDPGRLQLVPRQYHRQSGHAGGMKLWPNVKK